jgi:hypothetical protein
VCLFPANVKMAIDWSTKPSWMRALAYGGYRCKFCWCAARPAGR